MQRTVLFLCPHNAAKSVIAAAYCAREAAARGVALDVGSAGTEPDAGPAPAVVARLASEGIDVSRHQPRRVTSADLSNASRVVSMGCDAGPPGSTRAPVEHWSDVPAPSEDLDGACRAIGDHVRALVEAEIARA